MKLAVVTCHFNWAGFNSPVRNLRRFMRQMEADGVSVYGIELYLHGTNPQMSGASSNWRSIAVNERNMMFQKEVLIDKAVRELIPRGFDYIAAIDADVEFTNRNWVSESIAELQNFKIIQPFERCFWTDERGRLEKMREACTKVGLDSTWRGHPGFAWAMRRDFFNLVGMYPFGVLGSGDTVTASAILGQSIFGPTVAGVGTAQNTNGVIEGFMKKMFAYNGGRCGWIKGDLIHEWHGNYKNRRYSDRAPMAEPLDVHRDLFMNPQGILEWTASAPASIVNNVKEYFDLRKEDG